MVADNLYDRQEPLNLAIPESMAIIGVGGVGAWVAYFAALIGIPYIKLVDHDIVEETNRNRTPFRSWQVGDSKVQAIAEIILECREYCEVTYYQKKIEELSPMDLAGIQHCEYVIDCRDITTPLPAGMTTPITGGYDGLSVTMHVKPDYRRVFDGADGTGYRITPSYVIPPVFIALNILNYIIVEQHRRGGNLSEVVFNVDMNMLLRKLAGKKRYKKRLKNAPVEVMDVDEPEPTLTSPFGINIATASEHLQEIFREVTEERNREALEIPNDVDDEHHFDDHDERPEWMYNDDGDDEDDEE